MERKTKRQIYRFFLCCNQSATTFKLVTMFSSICLSRSRNKQTSGASPLFL